MKRRLSWLITSLCLCTATAQAVELVSQQEMQASLAAPETLAAKSPPVPGAPLIDVMTPQLNSVIPSPTPIHLVFKPAASSTVRPETFKVLYGRLRLDITQRLVSPGSITPAGIQIPEASLPKGSHRLLLSIEDTLGRQGQRQLDFEVN